MRKLGAAMLAGVLSGTASAQEVRSQDHGALAGPSVHERERRTIVQRDLFGVLQRPDETPEEAVAAKLDLATPERERVEKVFLRRLRLIDQCVAGNAELIAILRKGGGQAGAMEKLGLVAQAAKALDPVRREPALWEQVRAVLPAQAAPEFDRMMNEYWDAVAADGRARAPGVLERFAIISKERLAILGREIERSFQTLGDSGALAVTALTSGLGLDLTESQRSQLAVMAREYDDTVTMAPSEDQKRALVLKVLSILGPQQREKVLAKVRGGWLQGQFAATDRRSIR